MVDLSFDATCTLVVMEVNSQFLPLVNIVLLHLSPHIWSPPELCYWISIGINEIRSQMIVMII